MTEQDLQRIESERGDATDAMNSACTEYACPCHAHIPAMVAEVRCLQAEHDRVLRFMDGVRDAARRRNPEGATILDFMACWNEQYEDRAKKAEGEVKRFRDVLRELLAASDAYLKVDGADDVTLTLRYGAALDAARSIVAETSGGGNVARTRVPGVPGQADDDAGGRKGG